MARQKPWQLKWAVASTATPWHRDGGQGRLRLVKRADDATATLCVLKELIRQDDSERRARMYREVVALKTLPHASTPRVIDHNTDCYEDPSVDLYVVFEFIDGPTLEEYIMEHGPLPLNDALAVVTRVLDVLETYHQAGVGHRDIKPDNIILRDGNCASSFLIDFGMTFNVRDEEEMLTPRSQQVGNRFLSLPEHSTISANKRDLRSDLTFCVGVLYFALTGVWPATLVDEWGKLPHQRAEPRRLLDELPDHQKHRLFYIFDQGFAPELAKRWQTVAALQTQLELATRGRSEESATDVAIAP
jgi:eukaryotic-like serine/threonine-protein kinase